MTNPESLGLEQELRVRFDTHELHEFWPCELSLLDERLVDPTRLHGSRQVTDAYLLALAVTRGGRFVTFDGSAPLSAVHGAGGEHLVVLGAEPTAL